MAGHVIHYGRIKGQYTNAVDVGLQGCSTNPQTGRCTCTHTLSNLPGGVVHYFATTTYSTNGQSSEISNEVSWPPILPPTSRPVTLLAEGCTPVNQAVDPSESVTVNFAVQNVSGQPIHNLVGTLLPRGGVLAPSGPQPFGSVEAGGAPVSRPFTFTATGAQGGTLLAAVRFLDGSNDYGVVEYPLSLGQPATNSWSATNPAPILISASDGRASLYPSPITVAGVEGAISQVTLTLRDLSHTWFGDLQVLLVGPQGQSALVLSDAGGNSRAAGVFLTLDDDAPLPVPDVGDIVSGSWQPTSHALQAVLPAPAPAGPYESALRGFAGASPNGTWHLFVADDYPTDDGGAVQGGWSLTLTTTNSQCCLPAHATDLGVAIRDSQDPVPLTNDYTYTITVTNLGPIEATGVVLTNFLPPETVFVSASSSQGACSQAASVVRCDLGALPAFGSATISLVGNTRGGPTLTNTAFLTADQPDFNPDNNLAVEHTTVLVPTLSVFDASAIEDSFGPASAVFLVRLSRPTFLTVAVDCQTISVSAESGVDYVPPNNRLTFLPGEVSKTIEVPVIDDALHEGDETFLLRLSNPVNAVLTRAEAIGTIVDDDAIPQVSIGDAVVVEGDSGRTNALFTLSLSAPSGRPVTVTFGTSNGTAVAGSDYLAVMSNAVTIPALQTSILIPIAVNGDTAAEPDETYAVRLFWATNAVLARALGVGTIVTDDFEPILALTGFRVTTETLLPANADLDPGETVTVSVALRNSGTAPTTNLTVTLQAGNGVVSPSGPQVYGVIPAYVGQVARPFTFTVGLTNCGSLQPTFRLQDGTSDLGVATAVVPVGGGAELAILSLGTNQSREVEQQTITGNDRGGIAVSANHVLVTGDDATGQFALTNLSRGTNLQVRYDGLVSDLSTETVYVFGDGDNPMSGVGQMLTSLLELNDTTGALTGRRIDFSAPIPARYGSGVFAGYGRVVLWDGARAYEIQVLSGQVTDLGLVRLPRYQPSRNWAFWGVAEHSASGTNLVYVADPRTIVRTRIADGLTTAVSTFSNLSETASFTISPRLGRWYFSHVGSSQFGKATGDGPRLGYAQATFLPGCGNAPPTIQQHPRPVNGWLGGPAQFSVTVGGRGPFQFQWRRNGTLLPGAIGPSLTISNVQPGDLGDYTVEIANLYGITTSAVARLTLVTPVRGLADDFDPDIDYSVWVEFGGQAQANPIGDRVSGAHSLWLGGEGSRFATTVPIAASAGGTISFWLRMGDGSSDQWNWVSLPDEGVALESSKDGGVTWATLGTYAAYDFYAWTYVELAIPPVAATGATLVRWRQLTNAGPCCAHWALDDVVITTFGTNDPPQITSNPVDSVVTEGRTATLTVTAAGSRPLSYQWLKLGLPLPGAVAATLEIPNARFADAGGYAVVVANAFGTVTSAVATLTVQAPVFVGVFSDPQIVQTNQEARAEGATVRESLRFLGYEPVPFTDFLSATATYPVLVIPKQELGELSAVLSSAAQAALSNFVWQGRLLIVHGSAGRAASLLNALFGWSVGESAGSTAYYRTVQAGGTLFADDPSPLADNQQVYTLYSPNLPPDHLRLYTNGAATAVALIHHGSGKVIYLGWDWNSAKPLGTQDNGWLPVLSSAVLEQAPIPSAPPTLIEPPANQTIPLARTATFRVTVAGSRPLEYQWDKDGTPLPGATSSALSITNVQLSDAGAYSVRVTNLYGAVTSSVATLTVRDVIEVAVFDDPFYTGTSGGVQASLLSLGFDVSAFTSIEAAVQTNTVLLFPKFTLGNPASWPATTLSALSNFVFRGGLVIVQGSAPALTLLNNLLGSSLIGADTRDRYHLAPGAATTQSAGNLPTARDNHAVFTLQSDSLPPDSLTLYTNGGVTAAALWRRGAGTVTYLGWDWVDALPQGLQDGGWLLALANAVQERRPASNAPPLVAVSPVSQTVAVGIDARFMVGVSGAPPFACQWLKDGQVLTGAAGPMLAIPGAQLGDSGAYAAVVSNPSGSSTSAVATLTVRAGLLVSVFNDPRYVDTRGDYASEATTVLASLDYLGFVPGTFGDIGPATSERPILLFPKIERADLAAELALGEQAALSNFVHRGGSMILHGSWSGYASRLLNKVFGLQVADANGGSATPDTMAQFPLGLQAAGTEFADDPTILPNPYYTYAIVSNTLPRDTRNLFGLGAQTAVALMPVGAGKIIYLGWDWYSAIPLGTEDGGWLQVLESAVLESAGATNPVPTILSPPTDQRVPVGGTAQFGVVARGRAPLTYQWRKNGIDLPGANASSLSLSGVQIEDLGSYSVVVKNLDGLAQSAEAALRLFTPGIDLFDDFDPGIDGTQWTGFGGTTEAQGVGGSLSGANSLWFGGEGMRYALTRSLDTTRGGSIAFSLRFADGLELPWEAPELPQEGVVLESSSNAGASWLELARCDTGDYRAWRTVQVPMPPAVRTAATLFRWRQLDHSGPGFDHWALEDVWINANSIPPRIEIRQEGSELVLTWPSEWTGYAIQQAHTLSPPVPWQTMVPQPPVDEVAGQNVVRLPPGLASRFYRLIKP